MRPEDLSMAMNDFHLTIAEGSLLLALTSSKCHVKTL
jgi:hypothetical protein